MELNRNMPGDPHTVAWDAGDLFDSDWDETLCWNPNVLVHLAGPASVRDSFKDLYAGTRVEEIYRQFGVSQATFYNWK